MRARSSLSALVLLMLAGSVSAAQTAAGMSPYDSDADAAAEVEAAQHLARQKNLLLMVLFGANWCPDCRYFDAALRDSGVTKMVDDNFVIAKVDVGNWDRNLDIVETWGDPIAGGIPAIVVTTATGAAVFTSKAGDLARARYMDQAALVEFFQRVVDMAESAQQPTSKEKLQ